MAAIEICALVYDPMHEWANGKSNAMPSIQHPDWIHSTRIQSLRNMIEHGICSCSVTRMCLTVANCVCTLAAWSHCVAFLLSLFWNCQTARQLKRAAQSSEGKKKDTLTISRANVKNLINVLFPRCHYLLSSCLAVSACFPFMLVGTVSLPLLSFHPFP